MGKILAVGAHPDDVEFLMAGTLAQCKRKGWEVAIGIVAKGDCGTQVMSRSEITRVRRKEAEKAASLMGAEIFFVGLNDLEIDVNAQSRRMVTEVVRKSRADVVLANSPTDYMADHETASRLVRDACFCAPTPNYETGDSNPALPLDQIPALFYSDPLEGIDIFGKRVIPQFYVDITSQMDLKREMLACHASQRDWLRAQHGIDQYLIAMEEWAHKCGQEAGFAYAEGFRQHLGHAFPSKNVLKEILGDLVN